MKRVWIWVLCGVAALMLTSCGEKERHVYVPEERVVLSEDFNQSRLRPNFDMQLLWSDVVVRVKVLNDGTETYRYKDSGNPDNPVQILATTYNLKVEEVWQGEVSDPKISLIIRGGRDSGVTKPLKNDELVLFLRYDSEEDAYGLIDYEYSIFAVNPDETMYAFGNESTFTTYDSDSVDHFYQQIQERLDDADALYQRYGGDSALCREYVSPALLAVEGDVTE